MNRLQLCLIIAAIISGVSILSGCYTEIALDINNSKEYVVSTRITNLDDQHSVVVTFFDNGNEQLPVVNAIVFMEDDESNIYRFNHFLSGEYIHEGIFSSENSYRLIVELGDDVIISDWQKFPDNIASIDSLFFDASELFFVDDRGIEQSEEQIEFLVNFQTKDQYYALLDYRGIYEVTSVPLIAPDPPVCWISEFSVDYLNPVTISPGDPPFLVRSEFINTKFRKYNLIVEQYIIDEKGFQYWDKQNMLRQTRGNIFDPIPFSIDGNLRLRKSAQPVFGFFSLANYSSKRFAFDIEELPFFIPFSDCELDFLPDGEVVPECADCILFEFSVNGEAL